MTTTDDTTTRAEIEIISNFARSAPEHQILILAMARMLAKESLGHAPGARLAEMSDTDLRAIAFLFDLSLDTLTHMREKARNSA